MGSEMCIRDRVRRLLRFLLSINKFMDDLIKRIRTHLDEEHDVGQEILNEVNSLRTGQTSAGLA